MHLAFAWKPTWYPDKLSPPAQESRSFKAAEHSRSLEGCPWAQCCQHLSWAGLSPCAASWSSPQGRAAAAAGCPLAYRWPPLLGTGCWLRASSPGGPLTLAGFAEHRPPPVLIVSVTGLSSSLSPQMDTFSLISHSLPVTTVGPSFSSTSESRLILPGPAASTSAGLQQTPDWSPVSRFSRSDLSSTFHDMTFLSCAQTTTLRPGPELFRGSLLLPLP